MESQQNLLNCKTLIIGDTIATGSTLKAVLLWLGELRRKHEISTPLNIYICSIAGSSLVAKNWKNLIEEKDLFTVHLYLANGAWQLNLRNGTDLSLITNNKEEIHPKSQEYIDRICGKQFVKHMKCAVWDWGQRFDGISEHIKEVTEYFHFFHPADLPLHIRKRVYPNCKL